MPEPQEINKQKEFKENFITMNDSKEGMTAYDTAFKDQTMAENLMATGGGENLGSIETELASLSAMNQIRISERQQAFTENKIFADNVQLKTRDKAYVEATGEINRRKNIKSHRYDKTRDNRMETSNKTMAKANEKIRALKEKLKRKGDDAPEVTKLEKVKDLEQIYDNIRVADRNFAEALSLNKEEEKNLKEKAELAYRSSLKRMYEREMEGLSPTSPEYTKLKRKYDDNLKIYNKLMLPIWKEQAKLQEEEDIRTLNTRKDVNKQQEVNAPGLQLMDQEAEEKVSANVSLLKQLCDSLTQEKYGTAQDPQWNEMKQKANELIADWDTKTDLQRGEALAEVLLSANKYLSKGNLNSKVDKQRAAAAGQFRAFFKNTLGSMSVNCRVLALDKIYEKLDAMDEDENASEELKKQNKSVFVEMSRDIYKENFDDEVIDEDVLSLVDEDYYRMEYISQKQKNYGDIVFDKFKNTKNYFMASKKFNFSRNMSNRLLADEFRVDRFGRVLEEDIPKLKQWEDLLAKMADCDTKGALEIQETWFKRISDTVIDKDFATEKGIKKKGYELKCFERQTLSMQNFGSDWKDMSSDPQAILKEIDEWNQRHPNKEDKIDKKNFKFVDNQKLVENSKRLRKLPVFKVAGDLGEAVYKLEGNYLTTKGITIGDKVWYQPPAELKKLLGYKELVEKGTDAYYEWDPLPIIHEDGTKFDDRKDCVTIQTEDGEKLFVQQNEKNPFIYTHEYLKKPLLKQIQESDHFFGGKVDFDQMQKMQERIDLKKQRLEKVEKAGMTKLKTLIQGELDDDGKTKLKELEKLFDEFMTEADNQIYQKEIADASDLNTDSEKTNSVYFIEKRKYELQKKKMNELCEKLEKQQKDFLTRYAGENAYNTWKEEFDKSRQEERKKEQDKLNEGLSVKDRVQREMMDINASFQANAFSKEEFEKVKEHYKLTHNKAFSREQKDRVLEALILPVSRDFTGAYLTEEDRYNDDFNKKYKEAFMKGDKVKIQELSKEFVRKTLPKVKRIPPEEVNNMTMEEMEKYVHEQFKYKGLKLKFFDNVNNDYNTDYPDLKVGFEELKKTDKEYARKIQKNFTIMDTNIIKYEMLINGFDYDKIVHDERQTAKDQYKLIKQSCYKQYSEAYKLDNAKEINHAVNDHSVKRHARMAKAMENRKVGLGTEFEKFHDLSVFLSDNEEANKEFLDNFINFQVDEKTKTRLKPGLSKAYDYMTEKILGLTVPQIDITKDEELVNISGQLENIVDHVGAYERLISENPEYIQRLSKEKQAEINKTLAKLRCVAEYYAARKELLNDEAYRAELDKEIPENLPENATKEQKDMLAKYKRFLEAKDNLAKGGEKSLTDKTFLTNYYKSSDYLLNGIKLDANNLDFGEGERYKFIYYVQMRTESLPEDEYKHGVKRDEEDMKFFRNDKSDNLKEMDKHQGYNDGSVCNLSHQIVISGMYAQRVLSGMSKTVSGFMGTDDVLDMIKKLSAPQFKENRKISPDSKEGQKIDREFKEGLVTYKKILLYNFRCMANSFGNIPTQLNQKDIKKLISQYGDLWQQVKLLTQDASQIINNVKDKEILDPDDPEDKEFIFLGQYYNDLNSILSVAQQQELTNKLSQDQEDEQQPTVQEKYHQLATAVLGTNDMYREPIEHDSPINGPTMSKAQLKKYKDKSKKELSKQDYEHYINSRTYFEN